VHVELSTMSVVRRVRPSGTKQAARISNTREALQQSSVESGLGLGSGLGSGPGLGLGHATRLRPPVAADEQLRAVKELGRR